MESAVWGFIGTLVGALASLAGTWLTNSNTRQLHVEGLKVERDEKFRGYQRDNLIALQDGLHDLLRLVARGHHEDTLAFASTGSWGKALLSNEVSDGQAQSRRRIVILTDRLSSEELRSDIRRLNAELTEVSFATSREQANALWDAASSQGLRVLENIGLELRSHY